MSNRSRNGSGKKVLGGINTGRGQGFVLMSNGRHDQRKVDGR